MTGRGVRVGHGLDVHAFSEDPGRPLVLGGITIPGPGLAGHSDGDAVLHAVVDALLGAAGAGDIGAHFGEDDPVHAGAASTVFVGGALEAVAAAGWSVGNVDVTIVAQRPRLAAHREAIAASLARLLQIDPGAANAKATTSDSLGFTGRGEGIACFAVVLLVARIRG